MKRAIVLIVVLALLAAACGDSTVADESSTDDTAAATVPSTTTTVAPETTTTTVASTTTIAPAGGIIPGEDADVDAIVEAYQLAFDSISDYEVKALYIDDPSGLEETVAKYLTTGESMGGISVAVTGVTIDGESAEVAYDLLFNDNPTYPDLTGRAVLVDGGWKVPRGSFCALMSSARVGCP